MQLVYMTTSKQRVEGCGEEGGSSRQHIVFNLAPMVVCPHQYEHISSDKFLCHNNEGRSYGPAKVPKGPPDTLFLADFKQKTVIYSSKFKFSFNF